MPTSEIYIFLVIRERRLKTSFQFLRLRQKVKLIQIKAPVLRLHMTQHICHLHLYIWLLSAVFGLWSELALPTPFPIDVENYRCYVYMTHYYESLWISGLVSSSKRSRCVSTFAIAEMAIEPLSCVFVGIVSFYKEAVSSWLLAGISLLTLSSTLSERDVSCVPLMTLPLITEAFSSYSVLR